MDEIRSIPYVPVSHPFIERPIGTVRREYLDRVFFCNEVSRKPPLGTSTICSFYRHAKSPAPKAANSCFVGVFGRFFYRQAGNSSDGKFSRAAGPPIFTVRFTVKMELIPFAARTALAGKILGEP